MTRLACMLLALVALSGCGKRGNTVPPGPHGDITYPKTYPTE